MISSRKNKGFTLIEILVASAVLAVLLALLLTVTSRVSETWRRTTSKMTAFEGARAAFDTITSNLAQATLNTYWDYDQPQTPTKYERRSELHFLSGPTTQMGLGFNASRNPGHAVFFQAPTGAIANANYKNMPYLLNGWGYFVEFGSDAEDVPGFLQSKTKDKYRFRLKEWQVPSEKLSVYYYTSGKPNDDSKAWINLTTSGGGSRPQTLAENVILLLMVPRMPSQAGVSGDILTTSDFVYDSRTSSATSVQKNQMPPAMEVIMIAIDEASAQRLADENGTGVPPVFPGGVNFSDPTKLDGSLSAIQEHLDKNKIRYVLLRSIVPLRAGRWSQ
jgi:uncharacterized protein (TIGR02599 family)